MKNRNWLFTETPVPNLGAKRQGTPFNIDQWAAQNSKEIWISDQYKGGDSDKGRILLHEILVGIKLLKYLSHNETCVAQFGPGSCQGTNGAPLIQAYKLNDLDHEDVRKTVDWLFANHSHMNALEFGQKMHEGQFQSDQISFKKYLDSVGNAQKEVDVASLLKKNIGQTFINMYTDFDEHHVAQNLCKVKLERGQSNTVVFNYSALDAKSKRELRQHTEIYPLIQGKMLIAQSTGDRTFQIPLKLRLNSEVNPGATDSEIEIQFSVSDERPVGFHVYTYKVEKLALKDAAGTSRKLIDQFNCRNIPVELPQNYDAWIEMRAFDRELMEKQYFGSTLEELIKNLLRQHPDWK